MKKSKAVGISLLWILLFSGIQGIISVVPTMCRTLKYVFADPEGLAPGGSIDIENIISGVSDIFPAILLISNIVTILIVLVIAKYTDFGCGSEWELKKIKPVGIPVSFVFMAALSVVIEAVFSFVPADSANMEFYNTMMEAMTPNSIISMISAVVLAPICEELVFRGAIFSTLRKGFSFTGAAIISSLLFSLVHGNIIQGSYTFVVGLFLCLIYRKFNSLWCCIAAHVGFNLFGGYLDYTAYSRPVQITVILLSTVTVAVLSLWMFLTLDKKKAPKAESFSEQV